MTIASAQSETPAPTRITRAASGVGLGMREDRIQAALVQHLELRARPGVVWFHVPNGGTRGMAEAGRFKALGVKAGVPDLLIQAEGQLYCLELKAAAGRLSAVQVAMHAALRAAGAIVETAHGLDAALAVLARWGILKP